MKKLIAALALFCGFSASRVLCAESFTQLVTDSDAPDDAANWTYFWGNAGAFSPSAEKGGFVRLGVSVSKKDGNVSALYGPRLADGTTGLTLRIDPNGFPGEIALRVRDTTGETHRYPLLPKGGERGWREISVDLRRPHIHWGGANVDAIAFPASLGLQFDPGQIVDGSILVDEIRATFEVTEDNRYVFESRPTSPGNIWFGEKASVAFDFEDRLAGGAAYALCVEAYDDAGAEVVRERKILHPTAAARSVRTEVAFAAKRFGLYPVTATLRGADGRLLARVDTTGARVRSAASVPSAAPFGMNLSTATRAGADRAEYARLAAKSGVRWSRDEFSWERIEPAKGRFDWAATDAGVAAERAAGLNVLGLIAYSASWARRDASKYTSPPAKVEDYAEFVYAVVSRYKDRVKHWELWNEPDSPVFWPPKPDVAEFAALVEAGARAAKRADPSCTVMPAGLLVGMNHVDQWQYLDDFMKSPAAAAVDVMAWHAYCDPRTPEEGKYAERTRLFAEKSGGRRAWLTEQGWPTARRPNGVRLSALQQRDCLVRSHALALSDKSVEAFVWFLFRDGSDRDHDYEQSYGILNPDTTPKAAYPAYVFLTQTLGGAKPLGVAADGDLRTAAFATASGGCVTLVWCAKGAVRVPRARLASGGKGVFRDVNGNEIPAVAEVEITPTPLYVFPAGVTR